MRIMNTVRACVRETLMTIFLAFQNLAICSIMFIQIMLAAQWSITTVSSSVKQGNLGLLDFKEHTYKFYTFSPSSKHTYITFSYLKITFKSVNAHKHPLFILKLIFKISNLLIFIIQTPHKHFHDFCTYLSNQ